MPISTLIPTSNISQNSMININHGNHATFNGTQVNNYTDKKILDFIEELLNYRKIS